MTRTYPVHAYDKPQGTENRERFYRGYAVKASDGTWTAFLYRNDAYTPIKGFEYLKDAKTAVKGNMYR